MSFASDRAFKYRAIYGIEDFASEVDLDAILADTQVKPVMVSHRVIGPLPELMVDGQGYLDRLVERPWRRWLKAELIGHYSLHTGDQTLMPIAAVAKQETQAVEFAGWLLFGDVYERWDGGRNFAVTYDLVAEFGRVPLECVQRWWEIVGAETVTPR